MSALLRQLERYLQETLGCSVAAVAWRSPPLPHFLKERYRYARATLLGAPLLLVVDEATAEASPAIVRKHLDLLRGKQEAEVVYVRQQVTAYNRKRLIEHKVPFVVPGNQLYLPLMALDLREHFRRLRAPRAAVSPATQALIIYALLHELKANLLPREMARRLNYSAMTMTRVFDELEDAGLGSAVTGGRERRFCFTGSREETWAKAQRVLRSPVSKRVFVRRVEGLAAMRAGLTALAQYATLAAPPYAICALSREQWQALQRRQQVIDLPHGDPDGQEIEIWSYSPALTGGQGLVDPLSLYLSLKDDSDERTQACLQEMMRKLGW